MITVWHCLMSFHTAIPYLLIARLKKYFVQSLTNHQKNRLLQVSVQKQLSQFFRNQRRYSKLSGTSSRENDGKNVSVSKRAKISASEVDDVFTQKRNLELLRDCKEGDLSGRTYDTLIEETFKQRRKFVQSEAKSSSEILELCPYLGRSENVS